MRELLERDQELDAVSELLAAARDGRGGALLIEGEAGIGKTALLESAREAALRESMIVFSARGTPLEQNVAYAVARQLLLPAVLEGDDPDRLFTGAAELSRSALFGEAEPGPPSPDAAFAARHGLVWLVADLAATRGPLVLIADDLQWADDPSLGFIEALAGRAGELPLALLLGARPVATWRDPTPGSAIVAQADPHRPKRLSVDGVARMIRDGVDTEPAPAFAAVVHEETGGVPYLVAAVVAALRRLGTGPLEESSEARAALASASVERDVTDRLQGLPDEARALSRAVAVLGERPASEVQAVAGLGDAEAAEAAALLEAAGLVAGWPLPAFDHALVRSGVLAGLSPGDAAELHARAADLAIAAGESERAAAHLAEVPGAGDPLRAATLVEVGSRAFASGAAPIAVRHLRRALAEPPPDDAIPTVMFQLGIAEMATGDPAAREHLLAAGSRSSEPDERLRALMIAGHMETFLGNWDAGFRAMDEAISAGNGADPAALTVARLEAAGAMLTCFATGREASKRLEELDREVPAGSPVRGMVDGVLALRDARAGEPREAVLARIASALAQGPIDPSISPVLGLPLIALVLVDDFEQAGELFSAVVGDARKRGNLSAIRILGGWQAYAHLRQGRLNEAAEGAEALAQGAERPPAIALLLASAVRASVAIHRGDLAAAERIAEPQLELDPGIADTAFRDELMMVRARIRLARDDPAGARRLLAEIGERQGRWGAESPPVTQWRLESTFTALALGDADEARELAAAELDAARRLGCPRPLSMALRASAAAAGGDTVPARSALTEALEVLDGVPLALERARVCCELGELDARAGELEQARELLRRSLDLAWQSGADALTERARSSLRAAGGKPRRPELTGIRALTASEARTVRLAAAGAINREIAQEQFVTEKTVETHLTAAYRKLGISGRPQLAAALADGAEA